MLISSAVCVLLIRTLQLCSRRRGTCKNLQRFTYSFWIPRSSLNMNILKCSLQGIGNLSAHQTHISKVNRFLWSEGWFYSSQTRTNAIQVVDHSSVMCNCFLTGLFNDTSFTAAVKSMKLRMTGWISTTNWGGGFHGLLPLNLRQELRKTMITLAQDTLSLCEIYWCAITDYISESLNVFCRFPVRIFAQIQNRGLKFFKFFLFSPSRNTLGKWCKIGHDLSRCIW